VCPAPALWPSPASAQPEQAPASRDAAARARTAPYRRTSRAPRRRAQPSRSTKSIRHLCPVQILEHPHRRAQSRQRLEEAGRGRERLDVASLGGHRRLRLEADQRMEVPLHPVATSRIRDRALDRCIELLARYGLVVLQHARLGLDHLAQRPDGDALISAARCRLVCLWVRGAQIVELRQRTGWGPGALSAALGWPASTIWRVLRRYGCSRAAVAPRPLWPSGHAVRAGSRPSAWASALTRYTRSITPATWVTITCPSSFRPCGGGRRRSTGRRRPASRRSQRR
jgi:hypothetical protein